ncbi:hypothetical protein IR083_10050 [Dysgonomonas sp. GY75]|uniref:hypothetical protein n=1 Tax=Dysgonomonas sp. GY75 TaxID=2780419 RepID=UPI0018846E2C|nr:hypothetical protein [Dysgonomonas sp. GY75]MBF0649162.1 hypothetical protein [Dysgonomonas sp. GY75]
MNYLTLINIFWQMHAVNKFSKNEIALYFYLLHVFNVSNWNNTISKKNDWIRGELCISQDLLKKSRKTLSERGLIHFEQKGIVTFYQLAIPNKNVNKI